MKIKLKEILNERNMMQKELAELTGLRPSAISRLCRNDIQRIEIEHIKIIMEALEITDFNILFELEWKMDAQDGSGWIFRMYHECLY